MADWHPVTSGESGARVYRSADATVFRKVVEIDRAAALADERDRIRWACAHGVPGPVVLDWRTDSTTAELVTSAVAGVPADRLTRQAFADAWPAIVDAVRDLHALPVTDCPHRRDVATMLTTARDVVARDAVDPDFLPDEDRGVPPAALLARVEAQAALRRRQEEGDLVVCHGDLCLPNIVVDGTAIGFVDLGRLGGADRHADLSLLLESTAQTFPGFESHEALVDRYPWPVDDDRLRFYLWLDPLTW
ncbi:aminoglycoside 3'-phosphotransferase [Mycobacterium sp. PS03-16]|uniref:aminoglycoside 3'-phosphotransferase n=1 Tax=Mycobacterium sp. PS03-16 TaxID=2559611 RepID=UPI0010748406|nr:aminoglycoside 3'-phosphotransferase [Mycobacterium sp. PS03-16]TFV61358.1 aminoglycoside 3'-phosphotransferase [Mycobacterium sp. PS03-16]